MFFQAVDIQQYNRVDDDGRPVLRRVSRNSCVVLEGLKWSEVLSRQEAKTLHWSFSYFKIVRAKNACLSILLY